MQEIWLKIITRAWNESAFKARLLSDTDAVLREYHIDIPDGVTYQVFERGTLAQRGGEPALAGVAAGAQHHDAARGAAGIGHALALRSRREAISSKNTCPSLSAFIPSTNPSCR